MGWYLEAVILGEGFPDLLGLLQTVQAKLDTVGCFAVLHFFAEGHN